MISGDRKSYYKIALNSLENILEAKVKSVSEFRLILERVIKINQSKDTESKKELTDILEYFRFLEKKFLC